MPALEDFEFEYGTQRIIFGKERVSDLGKELERLGATRAFVICGPNILEKSDVIDRVTRALGERLVGVFIGVQPQAPVAVAEAAAKEVEDKRADVLISVGGGSTHDTAKGVAVLLAEGGSLQDWRLKVTEPRRVHVPAMLRPKLPIVAVSTTISGAETHAAAGLTDSTRQGKIQIMDPQIAPRVTIYDTLATLTTPPDVLAASGANALSSSVEGLLSVRLNPITRIFLTQSLTLLARNLPGAVAREAYAVQMVQVARSLAMMAVANTWLGITAAIAHCVSAHCGISQGLVYGVALPHGIAFNLDSTLDRQADLAGALGVSTGSLSTRELGLQAIDRVRDLVKQMGLPQRLRDLEVSQEDLAPVAEAAMKDRSIATNPRAIQGPEDVLEVLRHAW